MEIKTIMKLNESFETWAKQLPSEDRKYLENKLNEVRLSLADFADRIKKVEENQKTTGTKAFISTKYTRKTSIPVIVRKQRAL